MRISSVFQVAAILGFLAVTGVAKSQSDSEVVLPLPSGISIQSATANQLAAAVSEAIRANPAKAPEIVANAIAGLDSDDEEKVVAVITAALKAGKETDILRVVASAAAANPRLAPIVAATAAKLFPSLAAAISRAAAEAAPGQARAIALAVAAALPDQRDVIFASIRLSRLPRLDLGALGFAMGQGMNPANYVHGTTSGASRLTEAPSGEPEEAVDGPPRARPSPSPTPTSGRRQPPLGGGVVSPEH